VKRQHSILLILFLLSTLAACSPGHAGGNIIAFVRDGQLWTIDPNGANALAVVTQDAPVIGYGWSPNHQLLTFRVLDSDLAKTQAAQHLPSQSPAELIGDQSSSVNTIGVDGGTPIPIAFASGDVRYGNAQWNSNGTRLLFRQSGTSPTSPVSAAWWVSQNDQPGGIAIKSLPNSYSIPSLSYQENAYRALGMTSVGIFSTTLAGTDKHIVLPGLLPGHPLPSSLERILWQPAHQDQHFLYAVTTEQQTGNNAALTIQLRLGSINGHSQPLTTCTCTQFAWSPDGQAILYTTGTSYTIMDLNAATTFTFSAEAGSVPYWSPDSHFLLLDGLHTLTLVEKQSKSQTILLSDGTGGQDSGSGGSAAQPGTNALLQPVPNSIWAADSRHFLFLTHHRLQWQQQHLKMGLYTVGLDDQGHPQNTPTLVDDGHDTQAGWTYQDPNTSFLY